MPRNAKPKRAVATPKLVDGSGTLVERTMKFLKSVTFDAVAPLFPLN